MRSLEDAVANFNRATSPADLELELPFDLWRQKKRAGKVMIGDVVVVLDQSRRSMSRFIGCRRSGRYAVVVNEREGQCQLGISGEMEPMWIDRRLVQAPLLFILLQGDQ